jgi:hypothetical protein
VDPPLTRKLTTGQGGALRHGRRFIASMLCVIAGIVVTAALSLGTDEVLYATGWLPRGPLNDSGLQLLELAYRGAFVVVGGFITGRLTRDHPERHALVCGAVGLVLTSPGLFFGRDLAPVWYTLALMATALPLAWCGGQLAATRPWPRDGRLRTCRAEDGASPLRCDWSSVPFQLEVGPAISASGRTQSRRKSRSALPFG